MDHRLLGWSAPEGPEGDDEEEHAVEAVSVPIIRPLKQPEVEVSPEIALPEVAPPDIALPAFVDRRDMLETLNDALTIDPHRTAVITIDCQRSHLDLAVATMPVGPQAAASMVAATARLLKVARSRGMSVVHVLSQSRILPKGQPEALCNPFWAAVDRSRHSLIPDRESDLSRHNLVGTVQTQLMPELGPEPGDVLVDRKRRLSIYRDTDLDLTLRELGVDTVVLAGVDTSTSVLCAAFESLNRDLRTIVVADCVQSLYGDDLHFFGLQNVARCLGWVLTVDELTAKV